ncbi:hypothetical protein C8Q70DRAFT_1123563 [Cubamyces menziesii]|nr:hypothetical protein C8Q70DRAFT_1123563 [Cubamyces menziesii]
MLPPETWQGLDGISASASYRRRQPEDRVSNLTERLGRSRTYEESVPVEGSISVMVPQSPSPHAPSIDIPLPPSPPRKSCMGNRAVLSNSSYVSIDVLAARMEQEDAQDCTQELITPSSDPISVSSMGGDEDPQSDGATGPAPQPQSEDVQWAIALALHALEVDTVKSGEDLSCVRNSRQPTVDCCSLGKETASS